MMKQLEEKLWDTLQRLTKKDFQTFKWFLKSPVLEGLPGIPENKLEEASMCQTVDLMVQKYQGPGALKVTLEILEKVTRNDLVEDLLHYSKLLKENSHVNRKKVELKDKIEQMIQDRQMKIEEIRCSAAVSKQSAERYISDSEKTFQDLQQSLRRSLDHLLTHIEEKQKSTQRQAENLILELEQEIRQLSKASQEVEQTCQPLPRIPDTKDWAKVSVTPPSYGRKLEPTFTNLEESLRQEKKKLMAKAKLIRAQEFSKDVTLDPDTANAFLVLSPDRKQVHCGDVRRDVPDNPGRFQTTCNVLGSPSCSSGRFYFQVQVEGLAAWDVGVASEQVQRSGSISASPENGFWTICMRGSEYKAPKARLRPQQPLRKVGVFVEYEDARVLFFDVDTADLLHQFDQCSFSGQLRPFFSPGRAPPTSVRPPMVICPASYHL